MPTIGSLAVELTATTQRLRKDFAEAQVIAQQGAKRMSQILDEFGRPAWTEFSRSTRRQRDRIEQDMRSLAKSARTAAVPFAQELSPALGQTFTQITGVVTASASLATGFNAVLFAAAALAGMAGGALLKAWQDNAKAKEEFNKALESGNLDRVIEQARKAAGEIAEMTKRINELKATAPAPSVTDSFTEAGSLQSFTEAQAERDRDQALERLRQATRISEGLALGQAIVDAEADVARVVGEQDAERLKKRTQALEDFGTAIEKLRNELAGLNPIQREFWETMALADRLRGAGLVNEANELITAAQLRRQERFATEVLGPRVTESVKPFEGFEAGLFSTPQELLDAAAMNQAQRDAEFWDRFARDIEAAVAPMADLEAGLVATNEELLRVPKVARPLDDLETTLANISAQKQVFGRRFDEVDAKAEAFRSTIVALLGQGLDPMDSRVQDLARRLDELNRIQELKGLFEDVFGALDSAFSTSIRGVIQGTQTISQAFANMGQSVVLSITEVMIRRGLNALSEKLVDLLLQFGPEIVSAFLGSGMAAQLGSYFVSTSSFTGVGAQPYAEGGIVPATPGGRLILAGEGGEDEAVIPLSKLPQYMGAAGGGPQVEINFYTDPDTEVEHQQRTGADGRAIHDFFVRQIRAAVGSGALDRDFATNFGVQRRGAIR